ncbi:MAG: molybdopterin-guanine dinucleotide biosynthesis protein MobB [Firmicutes bacterium]|nr:molybdopterin-guanine dinucleotide biosynthesis protein MobB [Bacillota bacterium]
MRVLHIAGPANSGKTRLILELLPRLEVALVVKWTHHALDPEPPTADTRRFGSLGVRTLLAAPNGLVVRPDIARPLLYQVLATSLPENALILVEGDKEAPQPKIWLGPALPPKAMAVSLVIGPDEPSPTVPWMPASVPLTHTAVKELAAYLAQHWPQHCYTIKGGRACE